MRAILHTNLDQFAYAKATIAAFDRMIPAKKEEIAQNDQKSTNMVHQDASGYPDTVHVDEFGNPGTLNGDKTGHPETLTGDEFTNWNQHQHIYSDMHTPPSVQGIGGKMHGTPNLENTLSESEPTIHVARSEEAYGNDALLLVHVLQQNEQVAAQTFDQRVGKGLAVKMRRGDAILAHFGERKQIKDRSARELNEDTIRWAVR